MKKRERFIFHWFFLLIGFMITGSPLQAEEIPAVSSRGGTGEIVVVPPVVATIGTACSYGCSTFSFPKGYRSLINNDATSYKLFVDDGYHRSTYQISDSIVLPGTEQTSFSAHVNPNARFFESASAECIYVSGGFYYWMVNGVETQVLCKLSDISGTNALVSAASKGDYTWMLTTDLQNSGKINLYRKYREANFVLVRRFDYSATWIHVLPANDPSAVWIIIVNDQGTDENEFHVIYQVGDSDMAGASVPVPAGIKTSNLPSAVVDEQNNLQMVYSAAGLKSAKVSYNQTSNQIEISERALLTANVNYPTISILKFNTLKKSMATWIDNGSIYYAILPPEEGLINGTQLHSVTGATGVYMAPGYQKVDDNSSGPLVLWTEVTGTLTIKYAFLKDVNDTLTLPPPNPVSFPTQTSTPTTTATVTATATPTLVVPEATMPPLPSPTPTKKGITPLPVEREDRDYFPSGSQPLRPVLSRIKNREPNAGSGEKGSSTMALAGSSTLVFSSKAKNLTKDSIPSGYQVFLRDSTGIQWISTVDNESGWPLPGDSGLPESAGRSASVSTDGNVAAFHSKASAFQGQVLLSSNIFLFTKDSTGERKLQMVPNPESSDRISPHLSADGGKVVFMSRENSVWQIHLFDRGLNVLKRISAGNYPSWYPSISPDGRYVVFLSSATNLSPGDTDRETDIYLYDDESRQTTCLTAGKGINASVPNVYNVGSSLLIPFASSADLDTAYPNALRTQQVYLCKVENASTPVCQYELISKSIDGKVGDGNSGFSEITMSADGQRVLFSSEATNLVPDLKTYSRNVYLHDRRRQAEGSTSVKWSHGRTGLVSKDAEGNLLVYKDAEGKLLGYASDAPILSATGERAYYITEDSNIAAPQDGDKGRDMDIISVAIQPLPELIQSRTKPERARVVIKNRRKGRKKWNTVTVVMQQYVEGSVQQSFNPDLVEINKDKKISCVRAYV